MEMYKDLYTNILETLFSLLPVSWMARLPPSNASLAPLTLPGYPTTESPPWTGSSAQVLQVHLETVLTQKLLEIDRHGDGQAVKHGHLASL